MEHPPWVGRGRDFRARFERGDEHVDRRRQKEDYKDDQKEIRPEQRSPPAARDAAVAHPADPAGGRFCRSRRHRHASFPRRLTLRKMKNAAIANIGAMNSATDAPSGISLPQISNANAQRAKKWVRSTGPPFVNSFTI